MNIRNKEKGKDGDLILNHQNMQMDLEKIATSAIVTEISKTDTLSSFINSGDKEPCWDGSIYIHEDKMHTKKNIKRISTQVKGKAVKSGMVKEKINYRISYDDLNAYMMEGGTLFFVVYIDKENGNTLQIYYATLLPIVIKELFEQKKKYYFVTFKKFPQDNKKKKEIVFDAYNDAQKQKSYAGIDLPTIEELNKKGVLESLNIHLTYVGNKISPRIVPQIMEGKSFTVYAKVKGNPIGIPVAYHKDVMQVTTCQEIDERISVNGVEYFNKYRNVYSASSIKTIIGKCITITSKKENNKSVSTELNFDIKGTLKEQIKGIEFLLAIINNEGFEIGDVHIILNINSDKRKLNYYTKKLQRLKELQDLLESMHIKKDLCLDEYSEDDEKKLNSLIGELSERKIVHDDSQKFFRIHKLKIANLVLGVTYVKHPDGNYYMDDYFNNHFQAFKICEEKEIRISQFFIMKAEDFVQYDNIYLPSIVEDLRQIPISSENVSCANFLMLEMIKAYDKCQMKELLDSAEQINEWIKQYPDLQDKKICIINGCQIKIRQKKLSYADKNELFKIAEKTSEMNYRAGVFILLGYMDEVDKIFSAFNDEQMKEFMNYPLYNLYRKYKKK